MRKEIAPNDRASLSHGHALALGAPLRHAWLVELRTRLTAVAVCISAFARADVTPPAMANDDRQCVAERRILAKLLNWQRGAPYFRKTRDIVGCNNGAHSDESLPAKAIPAELRPSVDGADQLAHTSNCPGVRLVARYQWARIQYEYNHFEEAARGFREVLERYRTSEQKLLIDAVNGLFDSLVILKRYDELLAALNRYCRWSELNDQNFRRRCEETDLAFARKRIEGLEREKRFDEAGRGYAALVDRFPRESKPDELLYDAWRAFRLAGNEQQAMTIEKRLRTEHPKSPVLQKLR